MFDLVEEQDFAHEFREVFLGRGYRLFLPPTALVELDFLSAEGRTPAEQNLAREGLLNLRGWGIQPFDLDSTAEGIARRFAGHVRELGLIPDDEVNDGLILAETSLVEIPLLVTSDRHLLDVDEEALLLAFHDADLPPVHPVHPKRLLRALR